MKKSRAQSTHIAGVIRKMLAVCFTILLLLNLTAPAYANELNPLQILAESHIVRTETENEVTYSNLQGFFAAVQSADLEISNRELALFTLSYMRPNDVNFEREFPGDSVTEILSYYSYTVEETIMIVSENGEMTPATAEEIYQLHMNAEVDSRYSPQGTTPTADMCLQFTTTKAQGAMVGTDRKYVLTVIAKWLSVPAMRWTDTIAITYGGAIDDSYAFFASHTHNGKCTTCGNTIRNYDSIALGPTHTQTSEIMSFDYTQSNAISARIDIRSLTCVTCAGGTQISNINETELSSYLRIGILVSGTSETRSTYSHTKLPATVVVSAAVSGSVAGGFSVTPTFSIGGGTATNYVAPPLTLTVY